MSKTKIRIPPRLGLWHWFWTPAIFVRLPEGNRKWLQSPRSLDITTLVLLIQKYNAVTKLFDFDGFGGKILFLLDPHYNLQDHKSCPDTLLSHRLSFDLSNSDQSRQPTWTMALVCTRWFSILCESDFFKDSVNVCSKILDSIQWRSQDFDLEGTKLKDNI